jgi:hypothetical protein
MKATWRRGLMIAVAAAAAVLSTACAPHQASPGNASFSTAPEIPASPAPPSAASPAHMRQLIHPTAGKYFGVEADGAPDSLAPVQAFASRRAGIPI